MAVQRLSTWLALRCREPLFQQFLGAAGEAEAAEVVRVICGVDSRAQIDTSIEAQRLCHDVIRKPYLQFQQQPKTDTTQENK